VYHARAVHPSPGTIIAGKFRLERPLAQGGMGSVWVAHNEQLDVPVAMKFMALSLVGSGDLVSRFEREAKAAAQLRHPNVVQIFEHGVHNGLPFIAMELLEGESLGIRLKARRRLSLAETSRIIGEVCLALRRAHERGIVHRDLKPANIFLCRHDELEVVKVLDFGVAKSLLASAQEEATRTGVIVGSPHYMSPEQARRTNRPVDHRSDLWAIGVIAYRCLVGQLPFPGDDPIDVLVRMCTDLAPAPSSIASDLGPAVDRFFTRALARDPEDRFQSARELAEALAALSAEQAERRSLPPPPSRATSDNLSRATSDNLSRATSDNLSRATSGSLSRAPSDSLSRASAPPPRPAAFEAAAPPAIVQPDAQGTSAPAPWTPRPGLDPAHDVRPSLPHDVRPPLSHTSPPGSLGTGAGAWGQGGTTTPLPPGPPLSAPVPLSGGVPLSVYPTPAPQSGHTPPSGLIEPTPPGTLTRAGAEIGIPDWPVRRRPWLAPAVVIGALTVISLTAAVWIAAGEPDQGAGEGPAARPAAATTAVSSSNTAGSQAPPSIAPVLPPPPAVMEVEPSLPPVPAPSAPITATAKSTAKPPSTGTAAPAATSTSKAGGSGYLGKPKF
jgi:serine/threonine protein kinase